MAVGQHQWYHFGIGAPPILVYFSWDWDVHWGYGVLTHSQLISCFEPWLLRRSRLQGIGYHKGPLFMAAPQSGHKQAVHLDPKCIRSGNHRNPSRFDGRQFEQLRVWTGQNVWQRYNFWAGVRQKEHCSRVAPRNSRAFLRRVLFKTIPVPHMRDEPTDTLVEFSPE